MIIYAKTCERLIGIEVLKPYVEKYKGIEIQMLSWDETEKIINIVENLKERFSEIQEITVHPPLNFSYNFEVLSYANFQREIERVKCFVEVSKKYNVKMNLLYHTEWPYIAWKSSGIMQRLRELVNLLQNTNVNILIENIHTMNEREECTVLKVVKEIDNPHLGVCLDICHLHVQANIFGFNFNEFLSKFINKEDCQKYVYQIHFAGTLDNDGYRRKETHGRKHDTMENFEADFNLLKKYGIENKIIVSEISENDYSTRVDQLEEIKMLEMGTVLLSTKMHMQ